MTLSFIRTLPIACIIALLTTQAIAAPSSSLSSHAPMAVESVQDFSERPAPELWSSLRQTDKDAVTQCVRGSSYVNLVLPDVLDLTRRHQDAQAVKRVQNYCQISAPAARAIVALTAYVYGVR